MLTLEAGQLAPYPSYGGHSVNIGCCRDQSLDRSATNSRYQSEGVGQSFVAYVS